ncbi:hypothetical protein ACE6H2_012978 [Prunus campanulata]
MDLSMGRHNLTCQKYHNKLQVTSNCIKSTIITLPCRCRKDVFCFFKELLSEEFDKKLSILCISSTTESEDVEVLKSAAVLECSFMFCSLFAWPLFLRYPTMKASNHISKSMLLPCFGIHFEVFRGTWSKYLQATTTIYLPIHIWS